MTDSNILDKAKGAKPPPAKSVLQRAREQIGVVEAPPKQDLVFVILESGLEGRYVAAARNVEDAWHKAATRLHTTVELMRRNGGWLFDVMTPQEAKDRGIEY